MRHWLCLCLVLVACKKEAEEPDSTSGAHWAAREAASEIVTDCRSRGFEVDVKRGGTACRHWVAYEVHCRDDSVAGYAKLVCDERDDYCGRPSEVCRGDE